MFIMPSGILQVDISHLYTGFSSNSPDSSLWYSGASLDANTDNRLVIAVVSWKSSYNADVSSLSLGATPLTLLTKASNVSAGRGIALFYGTTTTEGAVTPTIGFTAVADEAQLVLYSVKGLTSLVPLDSGTVYTTNGTNPSTTLSTIADGAVIAGAMRAYYTETCTISLAGTTIPTDSDDHWFGEATTAASEVPAATYSEATVLATISGTGAKYLVAGSWR